MVDMVRNPPNPSRVLIEFDGRERKSPQSFGIFFAGFVISVVSTLI